MKTYDRLKPWTLVFSLNGFTHEFICPQISNIILTTWGQQAKKCSNFSLLASSVFLSLTFSLKGP